MVNTTLTHASRAGHDHFSATKPSFHALRIGKASLKLSQNMLDKYTGSHGQLSVNNVYTKPTQPAEHVGMPMCKVDWSGPHASEG